MRTNCFFGFRRILAELNFSFFFLRCFEKGAREGGEREGEGEGEGEGQRKFGINEQEMKKELISKEYNLTILFYFISLIYFNLINLIYFDIEIKKDESWKDLSLHPLYEMRLLPRQDIHVQMCK